MRLFIDAAPWATTLLPIKRTPPLRLLCCLLLGLLSFASCAQAEKTRNPVSVDNATIPFHPAFQVPVVASELSASPSLPRDPPFQVEPSGKPSIFALPAAPDTPAALPALPTLPTLPPAEVLKSSGFPSLQSTPTTTPLLPALNINTAPQDIRDDIPTLHGIDLITPPDDLWQRVRNGFSMPNIDSSLVAERQAWYLNRPELLRSVLNRSRRYLFYIVGELEKRGMPTELALLPMVESSYNPMAYSPARASGLWQFIPSTGKNYRLQQDWWQDQRRDVIASTGAALSYLQNIYEMHGDWHLALASYNWGEAAVARAIAKNQARHLPTDYLSINMPAETRQYVPKLQALKNIIAQPRLFGIRIDPVPNQPYFDTVGKTANIDVDVAARLAEVPLNEFLALNPSYNRPVIPGGTGSPIILPADKVQTFLTNLERHEADEKPLSNWTTYTLKKGERLDKVAARYGMSLARLKQINSIGPRVHIHAGNRLLVPGKNLQLAEDDLSEADLPKEAPPVAKTTRPGARKHTARTHASSSAADKRSAKTTRTAKSHGQAKAPAKPHRTAKATPRSSGGKKRPKKR